MAKRGRKAAKRTTAPRRTSAIPKTKSPRPKATRPKTPTSKASKPKSDKSRSSMAQLKRELRIARDHQAATSDILRIISQSPADVQPVFDAIVNSAAKLFEPCAATITTLKDGKLHWNAIAELVPSFDHQAV